MAQLRREAEAAPGVFWPVRLEAVVCWIDGAEDGVALQDESGAAFFRTDLKGQGIRVGDRIVVKGLGVAAGSEFSLYRAMVLDNDGLHPMTEESGAIFLKAGKHPIDVHWIDNGFNDAPQVSYLGPELPRQRIPDAALFHIVEDPIIGTKNMDQGLLYQVYEGTWDQLTDFSRMEPVRSGTAANFDLRAASAVQTHTCAIPIPSPPGGAYPGAQSVTLSCATTGATIRYTSDGADPTSSSPVYSNAISVSATTTIKAKAFKANCTGSAIVSATYTIGGGGSLSGTVVSDSTAVNLAATGTSDWAHWPGYDHKASGGAKVSDVTMIDGALSEYANADRRISWNAGTPTRSAVNNGNGIYIAGIGKGFSFTLPADTTQRTVKVYIGGSQSGGTLTAQLSDSSAADYSDSTLLSMSGNYSGVYMLTYMAGSASQDLTITWKQASGSGNVSLQGATLSEGYNVLNEACGVDFDGYVEVARDGIYTFFIGSDDGSRLSLDERPRDWRVLAHNAFPTPRPLIPGQSLAAGACQWSEVEGKVTCAGKTAHGVLLEISEGADRITVELADATGICLPLLLNSRIRATGFCQSAHTVEGRQQPGRLLVPGLEQIAFLAAAAKQWGAYPAASIAQLRSGAERPGSTIFKLQGQVSSRLDRQHFCLKDETGEMAVELIEPLEEQPQGAIRVLGELQGQGTNAVLRSGLWREANAVPSGSTNNLPLLDSLEQVHGLKREAAKAGYPVRVRGVLTSAGDTPVLQDATRGVYLDHLPDAEDSSSPLQIGDYAEVEGVTGPGDFAPVIVCQHARRLGSGCLPDPAHPVWEQLMNGSMDCQYGEIEGLVTAVQTNSLQLLLPEGLLTVSVDDMALDSYAGAHIRIRGCITANWDGETHQVKRGGIKIFAPIIGLDDPPVTLGKQIGELLQFDARAGAFHRVRISGQILHARPPEYYLSDGTNGLRFITKDTNDLAVGDQVEVVGFPRLDGLSPRLLDASARKTGQAPLPRAHPIAGETVLSGSNDTSLVEMESRLLGLRSNGTEIVLDLQAESRSFVARLERSKGALPPLSMGSRLRLTGVYAGRGGNLANGGEMNSFELLLNSPADIQILERPSWWTPGHTLTVFGSLIGVLLLGAGWIASLRGQVEERTHELKEEIDERKRTALQLEEKARLLAAEIEERKRAESEVERIHKELLVTSRQAGRAEVATSVLHNVGNVLNSVNVSANLIFDQVKQSRSTDLSRVVALLKDHPSDLSEFMTRDPKGRRVPFYLEQLARHLDHEKTCLVDEVQSLTGNIEHIKDIVAMQQNYSRLAGVTEPANPADLIEDALRMHAGALTRHSVEVHREYPAGIPAIIVDKHKVLQVLVNLVQNAKYACDGSNNPNKLLTVRLAQEDGRVKMSVTDNGVGIPAENLARIFNFGFTTRKNGHGFALHSGANAAKEMGGTLSAHSEGPGRGATFCLELPLRPPSAQ